MVIFCMSINLLNFGMEKNAFYVSLFISLLKSPSFRTLCYCIISNLAVENDIFINELNIDKVYSAYRYFLAPNCAFETPMLELIIVI